MASIQAELLTSPKVKKKASPTWACPIVPSSPTPLPASLPPLPPGDTDKRELLGRFLNDQQLAPTKEAAKREREKEMILKKRGSKENIQPSSKDQDKREILKRRVSKESPVGSASSNQTLEVEVLFIWCG